MKQVVLNEYNIIMDRSAYLPIASGLLRAYAETFDAVKCEYRFMPFNYRMDAADRILETYDEPAVAGFSLSMWNEQLNLEVARRVKDRWPECLIVFGGPQVPQHPQAYFAEHPFIDVAVRAEGEEAFAKVLMRNLESRDFSDITGVTFRSGADVVRNETESPQPKDLDMYPSPYLEGLFDGIMQTETRDMQAIIETNRGCPFPCSFCYWGQGGLSRKYRFHGVERVRRELEWCAENKIKYVFNADSNFGMHKRDVDISQILVETKAKHGYPQKFRTCFGKNADERIYGIAKQLHDADMEKGITLALQSNDEQVLKNIQRQNIKLSAYKALQVKFNEANVPVYSELILGLPGETIETWTNGIEALLQAGLKNQLFTYLCQVFPNTEMSYPEYQKRFGIVTKKIELNEIHGRVRTPDMTTEYEHIIVTTNAMPLSMWRDMVLFSWWTMVLHSMKVAYFILRDRKSGSYTDIIRRVMSANTPIIMRERSEFHWQINNLLAGKGRGRIMPKYGDIYWDEEEASFLRLQEDWDGLYRELKSVLPEMVDVIDYQRSRMPSGSDFEFAQKTILWGRKSGTILKGPIE